MPARAYVPTGTTVTHPTGGIPLPSPQAALARARADPGAVLLEGVHALKHAVRFGARVRLVVTPRPDELASLLDELAPDVATRLPVTPRRVDAGVWEAVTAGRLPSPCLAVADRPDTGAVDVVGAPGRVLLLEAPSHLGNLGAAVRVAAAAGLGGVLVLDADPWHPRALRGGAGLQFALPVARVGQLPETDRPLVALDPAGDALEPSRLPHDAVLAFGTERRGLGAELLGRADSRVAIPMTPGVSSLNLATAVAVVAYTGCR